MSLLQYSIEICMYLVIFGNAIPYSAEGEYCAEPAWFTCSNHRCLSHWFVCDGEDDCGDNSDEINCLHNLNTCEQFRCKNGDCVDNRQVCDGFHDCADFSDEINCDNSTLPPAECNNQINGFLCNNGRCIVLNKTCNSNDDCGDNSDENEAECKKSEESCKSKSNCSHNCQKTPKGPVCSCPQGHSLVNNTICEDINECSANAKLCDQRCVNEAGSYYCTCGIGYQLQDDGRTCKAEGGESLLIFAMDQTIHGIYLDSKVYFSMIENLSRPVSVSMDANYVYWSDMQIGNKTIMRRHENGDTEIIITAGVGLPEEMALDWLTGNVYFIDNDWKHVAVCKGDGEFCTTILCDSIMDLATGLVLDPPKGELYWSECGIEPRISRAGMNGENVESLLAKDLGCPGGLTIDYPDERLFFVDSKRGTVESVSLLDGGNRRRVLQATGNEFISIAIFEMKLYWSDGERIESVDKRGGDDRSILVDKNQSISNIRRIHIYHPVLRQSTSNPCNSCSQLCLLARNGTYTCACKLGDSLSPDGKTCTPLRKPIHLAIASGRILLNYSHETLGKPRIDAISTSKLLKYLAYDPTSKSFISNDRFSDRFFRLNSHGRKEVIGRSSSLYLTGMDFDYRANNIYSSNSALRRIEIQSVETGATIDLEVHDEPCDILLVPKYSTMFVVLKSDDDRYRIDQISMSPTMKQPNHVADDLNGPKISLAWDSMTDRVFFADETTGSIVSFHGKLGNNRRLVRAGVPGIVGLAVMDRRIFWTLRNETKIQWIDERDRYVAIKEAKLPIPNSDRVEIMDLVIVNDDYDEHSCRVHNGGCSHLCFATLVYSPSSITSVATCECPVDMVISSENNRTCVSRNPNGNGASEKCTRCALC